MDPLTILALLNAGLTLVEQALPIVDQMKNDGKITAEQQDALLARYNSLKSNLDARFSGPEWQVTK